MNQLRIIDLIIISMCIRIIESIKNNWFNNSYVYSVY